MKILIICFISFLVTSIAALAKSAQPLTIERIFSSPELDGQKMLGLQFSPNGQRLSFLRPKKDNYEVLDLWEFDLVSKKPKLLVDSHHLKFGELSEFEKAQRERLRITRSGIVEYYWSELGDKIIFPASGDLYLHDFKGPLLRLTNTPASEMNVSFSPKDTFISYVRDHNLYILDFKTKKEIPVTTLGRESVYYGSAEFIAQEEMHRMEGYWWSKDEQYLAFTEVDESSVKWVDRYEINASGVSVRKQRYPEAGTANAKVRLGVIEIKDLLAGKKEPHWIALGAQTDMYLPRAEWNHHGQLFYQLQSRDQKKLDVFSFNPKTQKSTKVLTEKNNHWVHIHSDWKWMKSSTDWIWASEKTGFKHLYLLNAAGKTLRPLTQGAWDVARIEGVDETQGWVYFSANRETPLEQRLYRVSLKQSQAAEVVTKTAPSNFAIMDKEAKKFILYSSTSTQPTSVTLHEANGEKITTLLDNTVNEKHPLFPFTENVITPDYGFFKGPSGENIYYSLYKPKNFDPTKKYPLIVNGYGGPGAQIVYQGWNGSSALMASVLVAKGFVVARFDNRGSKGRGRKFADALYRSFGTVEVEDQKAGVEYLVKQGFIDAKRVGFYGWSYGGYLSLMLAAKAPETFKANVAVAPVTDFSLYDTHYTERYMGQPNENKKAYKNANVLEFLPNIKGRVLVMHGMADDNVLFTNSTVFFKKMQELGIIYESVTYPGSKHGISGKANQIHVNKTILDFFQRHL